MGFPATRAVVRTVHVLVVVVLLAALVGLLVRSPSRGYDASDTPSRQSSPAPTPEGARPNVLVIEADDMRTDEMRWMPHLNALRRSGLTFRNSFAPYPLCCPSRASFLTGEYAHNHGVLTHENPFGFRSFHDSRTLATVLQGSGYRTALVGKYLNGYGLQPLRNGRSSLHYVPPGWTDWYAGSDHHWKPGDAHQGSTYAYYDLTQNVNGTIRSFPGRYNTAVLGQQARRLISAYAPAATGAAARPWFMWLTPIAPHFGSPHEPDDPRPTRTTDGHLIHWKTPARPSGVKGRFDHLITHGLGTPPHGSAEADTSDKPRYLRKLAPLTAREKAALTVVSRQRAEAIFAMDQQIGRVVARLKKTGQYARTVIVFTSDNGYYLGEHRKRQGKINLHEPSLRVPLVIAGPGIPRGVRYDPISTVDLAPTITALAGLPGMPGADGIDMGPVIRDGDAGWTRPVVTEGRMPEYTKSVRTGGFNSQLNTRGLRLGRWKITMYATGESELYDLRHDPLELRNLARDPSYAQVRAAMRALWFHYKDCVGAECSAPLPHGLVTSVAQTRSITRAEARAAARFFHNRGAARY